MFVNAHETAQKIRSDYDSTTQNNPSESLECVCGELWAYRHYFEYSFLTAVHFQTRLINFVKLFIFVRLQQKLVNHFFNIEIYGLESP